MGILRNIIVSLWMCKKLPKFTIKDAWWRMNISVPRFSQGEFWQFVAAGGYRTQKYWWSTQIPKLETIKNSKNPERVPVFRSEDGWNWRKFRNMKWPFFWVQDGSSPQSDCKKMIWGDKSRLLVCSLDWQNDEWAKWVQLLRSQFESLSALYQHAQRRHEGKFCWLDPTLHRGLKDQCSSSFAQSSRPSGTVLQMEVTHESRHPMPQRYTPQSVWATDDDRFRSTRIGTVLCVCRKSKCSGAGLSMWTTMRWVPMNISEVWHGSTYFPGACVPSFQWFCRIANSIKLIQEQKRWFS